MRAPERAAGGRLVLMAGLAALIIGAGPASAQSEDAPAAAAAADPGALDQGTLTEGAQGEALPVPAEVAPETPPAEGQQPSPSDLAYGAYQRGFYLTALKLAEPIANLGDPAAQTLLGEIYSRALGVPQDLQKAAHWYEAAAKAGSAEGQFRFALMLLDGTVVASDIAKARDLMAAAAEQGLPLAQYNYAQMIVQASPSGGFEEAFGYFQKAANAGVADAQYAMSQLYEYGRGVQADSAVARKWLRAAAINGLGAAQVEFGIWLINGKGGPPQLEDGFRFLKRAADRGNPIAINRVAHLYKDGVGTAPDRLQAAKWAVLAKRVENSDPTLDDFFRGLDPQTQKSALEAANRFRSR